MPAKTHGMKGTRTYRAWSNAKARCYYPGSINFAVYGGAGVTMCDRWRLSFEAFLEDMGAAPDGLTLDRINGDRGYEPGNCRWASRIEQNRNWRTRNHVVELNGVRMAAAEAASRLGVSKTSVIRRAKAGKDLAAPYKEDRRRGRPAPPLAFLTGGE